jgi:hypothetical protein
MNVRADHQVRALRNLDAVNTYGVLTCCSAVLLLPPVMLIEGGAAWATVVAAEDIGMQVRACWQVFRKGRRSLFVQQQQQRIPFLDFFLLRWQLMRDMLLCGFLYYAYNECGFRVLDALGSVSA